ncbi:3-keto-5-aminohexanoate cleavage protein [Aminipila butyrica]|uniref:3-keto-5-aminohexanoate cleavage protein n=1 Tax=Aminipila butyrica TaxID=433296 RepID=A0A858BW54_9FIRM|nr:3-keto-5-aminohexanoate cleavage protein [Aminipila butyrica]QIB68964.1 3-keto-5-aminohexanoate cleavage protein [Aminipila butyrica]
MAKKTIITVATTGAWPSKKDNPNLPLTPQEIAEDVYKCYQAGAAVCHLHMRDDEGKGTMDTKKFEETVKRIKEMCDIVINCTTSGDLNATDETRQAHLRSIRPELASYDCGSMNWQHNSLFINHPKFLEELGKTMQECGVKPEIEIFDAGMIYNSTYYLKKGILKAPLHYQFVLGAAGGSAATVENLCYLKNLIPEGSTWSALGVGKGHVPILMAAIAMGGHVRVGMEDNVYYAPGVLAESNAQLVNRAADFIRLAGNEVATSADAREILGI